MPRPSPRPRPQLVQEGGHEYLLLKQGEVPGMTYIEVKDVALSERPRDYRPDHLR